MSDTASSPLAEPVWSLPSASGPATRSFRMVSAVAAETWKGLLIMWTFKFNVVTEVLGLFMVFLGISFFMGYGQFDMEAMASSLLGFIFWTYAIFAIGNMSFALREEQQQGTIEQMSMGVIPFWVLLFGRTLASLIWTTLVVSIGGGAITLGFGLDLGLNSKVIPIFLLSILGLYGLGYLVAGATLLFKNILSFTNLIQNILLFLNGAIVPITFYPEWMANVTRVLPTTLGIENLRMVTLEGLALHDVWLNGRLQLLTWHSIIWLAVGLALFLWADREARRRGLMGQF